MIRIGRIGRPWGVKGWVFVDSSSPRVLLSCRLYIQDRFVTIAQSHETRGRVRVQFSCCSDLHQAQALRGHVVTTPQLPPASSDEIYIRDLEGRALYNHSLKLEGTVHSVHDFGAGALFEIKTAQGAYYAPLSSVASWNDPLIIHWPLGPKGQQNA